MNHIQRNSSSTNAENADSKHSDSKELELVEYRPIAETPFTAVRVDTKWFLTMGKYRLTEQLDSYEQAEHDAQRADWTRIMQIMQAMIDEDHHKRKVEQSIQNMKP